MVGGGKEEAKVVVGKFVNFLVGVNKEFGDVTGTSLSTISGPSPGASASVPVNEAGGRVLSVLSGPGSGAPVPDAMNGAVRAW